MASPEQRTQRALGQQHLDRLAEEFLELDGVEPKAMFGSAGLRTPAGMLAFIGTEGELIIKVPEVRAAELVDGWFAQRVKIGRNPAREWIAVPIQDDHDQLWRLLIMEAYRFAAGDRPSSG